MTFDEQAASHHVLKELLTVAPSLTLSQVSLLVWTPPASARLSPSPTPCALPLVRMETGAIVHRVSMGSALIKVHEG